MTESDKFISITDPGDGSRSRLIKKVQRLRGEGKLFREIADILEIDASHASRVDKIDLESLKSGPPDCETWEYRPAWIKTSQGGYRHLFVREDGAVWDSSRKDFCRFEIDFGGYSILNVCGRTIKLHRLVAWAFHGPPPNQNSMVLHRDGIESNNYHTNLRWGTKEENAKDKMIHGKQRLVISKGHPWYQHGKSSVYENRNISMITRKMTFDSGHRVPFHESKCSNMHGHTWTLEATFAGLMNPVRGQTDDGMILDFGVAKSLMSEAVVDVWDHGFIVWRGDKKTLKALSVFDDHKTIIVDMPPTSEYLVMKAFIDINALLIERYGFSRNLFLYRTVLYETPNCRSTHTTQALKIPKGKKRK